MAVYKITSQQDAFINSEFPTANTGRDEILEIANYKDSQGNNQLSRSLVLFSTQEVLDIITNKIGGSTPFQTTLELYLANANEAPTDFSIECNPITQSWENGIGKFSDRPIDISGVSWNFREGGGQQPWSQAGGDFDTSTTTSQQFKLYDKLDIKMDITSIIQDQLSTNNFGLILKLSDTDETSTTLNTTLRYFSKDTNSIFPPHLSIKWDDSEYTPGDLEILDDPLPTISIINNKAVYKPNEIARFRLSPRPTNPIRTFTTSSIYRQTFALPEGSTWALKDEGSEEMIVDFDSNYTKISCDQKGPYFDVYMNGLQPERYYRLLFKTEQDSSIRVIDTNNLFKVRRYV